MCVFDVILRVLALKTDTYRHERAHTSFTTCCPTTHAHHTVTHAASRPRSPRRRAGCRRGVRWLKAEVRRKEPPPTGATAATRPRDWRPRRLGSAHPGAALTDGGGRRRARVPPDALAGGAAVVGKLTGVTCTPSRRARSSVRARGGPESTVRAAGRGVIPTVSVG